MSPMAKRTDHDNPYVSRGGLKLAAALDAFHIDPAGFVCADLGCSTGGFTDCLLQRGAAHVFAVDTAYGALAWTLRQNERVTVLERTNALHFDPRERIDGFAGCDLVTVDLGWTRQARAMPAAQRWLRADAVGVITLIKPHYEAVGAGARPRGWRGGVLGDNDARDVTQRVLAELQQGGWRVAGQAPSPVRGEKGGNQEWLAFLGC